MIQPTILLNTLNKENAFREVIMDGKAVYETLKNHLIQAAALDVFEKEF